MQVVERHVISKDDPRCAIIDVLPSPPKISGVRRIIYKEE